MGQVIEARLQYDDASEALVTRVTLEIDPGRIEIVHARHDVEGDPAAALAGRMVRLVSRGLRAHLTTANFLTGVKVVSLDIVREAARARIIPEQGGVALLPSVPSTDLSQVLATLENTLQHLDTATAGPALGHAVVELDRTLTHLDQLTADVGPEVKPLLESLHRTADATERTLAAANQLLGNGAASGADLPRLIHELTDASRSIRALADYLDRHPESLLRGRRSDDQ